MQSKWQIIQQPFIFISQQYESSTASLISVLARQLGWLLSSTMRFLVVRNVRHRLLSLCSILVRRETREEPTLVAFRYIKQ